jgi:hypothetical protein
MDDPIQQILRRADSAIPAPNPASSDLAWRVRVRAKKQRQLRQAALLLILVMGIVALAIWPHRPPTQPLTAAKPSDNLRQLEADADYHQLIANLVQEHERHGTQTTFSEPDEYLRQLAEERNLTALILVRDGDRNYEEFHDIAAAEASYRQVLRLFPHVPAAAVAEQRLHDLDKNRGNVS